MGQEYLRTYQAFDIEEIKRHLLILGDLTGNCASCKALGIRATQEQCPECGTPFRFITSRRLDTHPGERFRFARRMKETRPDLTVIDYSDYVKILGKKTARDFFG